MSNFLQRIPDDFAADMPQVKWGGSRNNHLDLWAEINGVQIELNLPDREQLKALRQALVWLDIAGRSA